MKKKLNYKIPLLFAVVAAFAMFVGARFSTHSKADGGNSDPDALFQEVMMHVNNDYVDKPDDNKLTQAAIEGMLKQLDPHSVFIPASELKETNEELQGNFEGIGIEFNILNDTIFVVTPISGGPSEKLGIRAGDKIIKINGKTVAGVGYKESDVFKNLRGQKGTEVTVSMYRKGNPGLLDFKIIRDKIPIYSIDASYMASPGVGYIKINRFGGTTADEFNSAFDKLQKQGMNNLILDLRGNPGGYLNTAIEIASTFLPRGKLVVYTQGRAREKEVYDSKDNAPFSGKVAVLIDEGSASASEIVTGALQDWDRALVIGRRSFGKGLVQEQFPLSEGSALRLTIARYYTPSGRCIQKSYKNGVEEYYQDFAKRYKSGELENKDSIKNIDSLKYFTNNHRVVYGGGGIVPDVFVPLDTTENSTYLIKLLNKGAFNQYILTYTDKHRDELKNRYPDFNSFDKSFIVDKNFLDEFVKYGEKEGVKKDDKALSTSGNYIKTELKALVARQLFQNDGFYEVVNEDNNTYQKALQTLKDNEFEKMGIVSK